MRTLIALHPPILMALLCGSLSCMLSLFFAPFVVIFVLDVMGRFRDLKYLSTKSLEYVEDYAVMDKYGRSWCGRTLIKTVNPNASRYYYLRGYRVWHLLPDEFFKSIVKRSFWKNLISGHSR